MSNSDPLSENVVGNVYDKYGTRNPIARWLMQGFFDAVGALYREVQPRTVLEVGCGEGKLADYLWNHEAKPDRFVACDLELEQLAPGIDPAIEFRQASIYELPEEDRSYDLVLCCEVLEHLEDPARGLSELARVADRAVLISTPWEPIWRIMNMARGRYLGDLGNTPGHIQHFSRRALRQLAQSQLDIQAERRPLPWTMLLGAPRR